MNMTDYLNHPNWRLSIGEKLDKTHFRNGHLHAECDSKTGDCSIHYDEHDPYESPTELAKHVWKSDLGKAAIIGVIAVVVGFAVGRAILKNK